MGPGRGAQRGGGRDAERRGTRCAPTGPGRRRNGSWRRKAAPPTLKSRLRSETSANTELRSSINRHASGWSLVTSPPQNGEVGEGLARPHISQMYITYCHSPPASQSARGAWRGDVAAMVASHALLLSGDDVTDFPIGAKLNFLYLIRDLNFIFKSDEVWLLSVILTYNCIVIPPSNNMFLSFVSIWNFRILANFRSYTRGTGRWKPSAAPKDMS